MQRHMLGIVVIVSFAVGAVAYANAEMAVAGMCLRIGGVLALLWLALPQLRSIPPWTVALLAVASLVIMRWPKLLLAAVPLAVILWLLRPRGGKRVVDSRD